jgi:predicted nucleotidyltransferase
MASIVQWASENKLITPPSWLPKSIIYEVMMGSIAYGVNDEESDVDIYGICIPPLSYIFPHLDGEIHGFGSTEKRFQQYIKDFIGPKDKKHDVTIFSIVKFFSLAMDNNPNILDALYVPDFCVLSMNDIGQCIRENRKLFLHRGLWPKFKSYAYSQLHKMKIKQPEIGSKRFDTITKYGYDLKFAYHVVRLIYEAQMFLEEQSMDLQRYHSHLKAVKCGEVEEKEIYEFAASREKHLESLFEKTNLPNRPDEVNIKKLLLHCIEAVHGKVSKEVVVTSNKKETIQDAIDILSKYI